MFDISDRQCPTFSAKCWVAEPPALSCQWRLHAFRHRAFYRQQRHRLVGGGPAASGGGHTVLCHGKNTGRKKNYSKEVQLFTLGLKLNVQAHYIIFWPAISWELLSSLVLHSRRNGWHFLHLRIRFILNSYSRLWIYIFHC